MSDRADVADYTEIYVMNADGSNRTNLTNNPAVDYGPSWSPDGKRIAFTSAYREGDLGTEIYVMDADGSNQKRLTNREGYDLEPRWSPDGKRIAFLHEGTLWVMDADGSHQTSLNQQAKDGYFVWSPDSKSIAFDSPQLGMAILQVDNRSLFSTSGKGSMWGASWSPDLKKIAFTSDRDGACEIYVMDADGSNLTRLTNFRDAVGGSKYSYIVGCSHFSGNKPAWSPDGKRIAFLANPADFSGWNVFVIAADGSNLTNLTKFPVGAGASAPPSWSSDGHMIAFTGGVYLEYFGILVMDADGSNLTRLTPPGSVDLQPSWRR